MRRLVGSLALCAVGIVAAASTLASGRISALPPRYAPNSLDGALVEVSNPVDGRGWAVWAYRNGAEYDVAVSSTDSNGWWQEPVLIGNNDRRNQTQPALAVDARGTVYLAFVDGPERRLLLSTLPAGSIDWSPAVPVTAAELRVSRPVLKVVGDHVALAYFAAGQVRLMDFPIVGSRGRTDGVSEGPDPFDRQPPPDDGSDDSPPPTSDDGTTKSPRPK